MPLAASLKIKTNLRLKNTPRKNCKIVESSRRVRGLVMDPWIIHILVYEPKTNVLSAAGDSFHDCMFVGFLLQNGPLQLCG